MIFGLLICDNLSNDDRAQRDLVPMLQHPDRISHRRKITTSVNGHRMIIRRYKNDLFVLVLKGS